MSIAEARRASVSSPAASSRGLAVLSLALYLAAFFSLYLDAGSPPASPLSSAAGGVFKPVLAGGEGRAWDVTVVLPTTASGAREAQALYAASLASTSFAASLVVVHGGGGRGGSGAAALGGRVRRLGSACPDASDIPDVSVAWHEGSHFSCKVLEGLCAATEGGHEPRYVAVAAEGAMFRWAEFLRQRGGGGGGGRSGGGPPPRGQVIAHVTDDWVYGLPEAYAASKPAWPRMPLWNSSVVFSADLAGKLCRLHRSGLLQLYGPPEMLLGMVLSTLEGVTWTHQPAQEAPAKGSSPAAAGCPAGLTVTKMTQEAWAACLAKAALEGDSF